MEQETRYQRIAREQAERQAARANKRQTPKRKAKAFIPWEDRREAKHIDGYDRDDLGYSGDY
jgi:hypothetical protein